MKKNSMILVLFLLLFTLCACSNFSSPISTTRPLPSSEPYSNESEQKIKTENNTEDASEEATEENDEETENADENDTNDSNESSPTKDVRDDPKVIREEISNLLRDAEDLINEGLYDDAKNVLRDLRSRDLTDAELEKVDELSSQLVEISD